MTIEEQVAALSRRIDILETREYPVMSAQANQYVWCEEDQAWEKVAITHKGVHLCASDVDATTGYVLVDLSDTVNYPHNFTGRLYLCGYQVSINPNDSFVGEVLIGYLENVDADNGDFKTVLCWKMEKRSSNVADSNVYDFPISVASDDFLVPSNTDDTIWQTDVALASPYDNVPAYTTMPGNGDIAMKIVRTAGEVSIGITILYYSEA